MTAAPMADAELERYAEMVLRGCVAFRPGDTLLIRAAPAHRELAVALADAAYRAGAARISNVSPGRKATQPRSTISA
jgi:leucyl aminopeptidase (aminopeptidase T)